MVALKWLRIKTVFALLLWAATATGQTLRLDSILLVIERQNPMLIPYETQARALDAYAAGARAWMPPMAGLGTFQTPYPFQKIEEERDKGALMLIGEQQIPNPRKLDAREKYLLSRAPIVREGRGVARNNLYVETRRAYYEWLVLEEKLKVLDDNEQLLVYLKKIAEARYPYNQAGLSNVFKAEGRLYELDNMRVMTRTEIAQKNIALNTLMNLPRNFRFQIDTSWQVQFLPADTAYLRDWLPGNRSDLRRLDRNVESMNLGIARQNAELKPDFGVRFEHMTPFGQMPWQFNIMGMVTFPIAPWSRKMQDAEIAGMKIDVVAMQQEKAAVLNEALGMAAQMRTQIEGMARQLENYETKILPNLRQNYDVLLLAYQENRQELPVVIDGWEALNMARMEYLDLKMKRYQMIADYEQVLQR